MDTTPHHPQRFGQVMAYALRHQFWSSMATLSALTLLGGMVAKGAYDRYHTPPKRIDEACRQHALEYVTAQADAYLLKGKNPDMIEQYEECLEKGPRE